MRTERKRPSGLTDDPQIKINISHINFDISTHPFE